MAAKQPLKTTFDVGKVIAPIFTGGAIAIDNNASILATTLGEDVVLTNPSNGEKITTIEGVGFVARILVARLSNRILCYRMGNLFLPCPVWSPSLTSLAPAVTDKTPQ